MSYALTTPCIRYCGHRESGGCYACQGTSLFGSPVEAFLFDPPVEYVGKPFQGVRFAPEQVRKYWPESVAVLENWVGEKSYPTVPSWVEETRRYGMSCRIQPGFDFQALEQYKDVYLLQIHAKAIPVWAHLPVFANARFKYSKCVLQVDSLYLEHHWPKCLYHLWPLAARLHKVDKQEQKIAAPSFTWSPYRYIKWLDLNKRISLTPEKHFLPDVQEYRPGYFGVWPISHFEVVDHVPENVTKARIYKSGRPIAVVAE